MLKIAVFFGGRSGEHEVSLSSGTTVIEHLDPDRYEVYAVGIRRDGTLATANEAKEMLRRPVAHARFLEPEVMTSSAQLLEIRCRDQNGGVVLPDVFFPVLHGPFGEDGTFQGLLELTGKPYVGCGLLTSSTGMDKEVTKTLFEAAGLAVVEAQTLRAKDWGCSRQEVLARIQRTLSWPLFVKPVRMGSSVGVTKAHDEPELVLAIEEALKYDYRVLVERGVDARELEVAVMGNHDIEVSLPGEILPSREFYDYAAKYLDGDGSRLLIPASMDEETTGRLQEMARRAFMALGGEGFARVDFLMDRATGTIYINEINTIPGFTEISMFPKLFVHQGYTIRTLLDRLISLALERHELKAGLDKACA